MLRSSESTQGLASPTAVPKDLGPLVGAIDQGTSSTRFLVFSAATAELVTYHRVPVSSTSPKPGWVEQDPMELLESVKKCIEVTVDNMKCLDVDPADIVAVGVTNQRETTIVWDRDTGLPLHNAVVWLDNRTQSTEQALLSRLPRDGNSKYRLQHLCGLPISSYFSALKLRWLLDHRPAVAAAARDGRLLFGTVDSWLVWNLTGREVHATDVTNASRTALMNLETLQWDPALCRFFRIPPSVLPEIRSSSEVYGRLDASAVPQLAGVPVSGVLGDQQAALVGQSCFRPGQAKCTFGTGCFALLHVGSRPVLSSHGLLTTVAYRLGPDRPAAYALEGSVAAGGGAVLSWLRDRLGLVSDAGELDRLAASVPDAAGLCFVPAFRGLLAPRWRPDARGTLCGLTEATGREHVCRAALEAMAFQVREILDSMLLDIDLPVSSLLADGGLSHSDVLMQINADLLGINVLRPSMAETTALGAAMAAGMAAGVDVWDVRSVSDATVDRFLPRLADGERDFRFDRWRAAVDRSLGWAAPPPSSASPAVSEHALRLHSSVPGALFVFCSLLLLKLAASRQPG